MYKIMEDILEVIESVEEDIAWTKKLCKEKNNINITDKIAIRKREIVLERLHKLYDDILNDNLI